MPLVDTPCAALAATADQSQRRQGRFAADRMRRNCRIGESTTPFLTAAARSNFALGRRSPQML
jgi:hypothetical protein